SSCLRMSGLSSTSNALQVPRPITGVFWPEEGIVRVSIADDSPFASRVIGKTNAAAVPPITFAASRRVTISTVGRLIRSCQLAQPFGLASMSLSSRSLHSVKRQCRVAQMPYNGYMPLWIAGVSSKYPLQVRLHHE